MGKSRLEAFSDGVIAIIITIMVLELKVPHEATFAVLGPLWPVLLSYVLSFVYVGIYWNNHHHMLAAARHVSGGALWANLHLLFWLSLFPFATAWMGENHFAAAPVAAYGVVLLMAAIAYWLLQQKLIALDGPDSTLKRAIGGDWKGKLSPLAYIAGIAASFWQPWISEALYITVALVWLVPDRRIEGTLHKTA
jgi:uncharacterized membrane protein